MASTQALSAAAQDRKSRLAQLKSLKRKQPDHAEDAPDGEEPLAKSPRHDPASEEESKGDVVKYLSGRNYDAETRAAKLGFETAPSDGKETLESKAAALAAQTKRQAEEEDRADKPLDLFKLQPKKPNWDLKRDLDRKLEILNVRTDNAIAGIVRERIAKQQQAAKAKADGNANGGRLKNGDDEAVGIEGATLVEATNVREREDENDARREREEEERMLEDS